MWAECKIDISLHNAALLAYNGLQTSQPWLTWNLTAPAANQKIHSDARHVQHEIWANIPTSGPDKETLHPVGAIHVLPRIELGVRLRDVRCSQIEPQVNTDSIGMFTVPQLNLISTLDSQL